MDRRGRRDSSRESVRYLYKRCSTPLLIELIWHCARFGKKSGSRYQLSPERARKAYEPLVFNERLHDLTHFSYMSPPPTVKKPLTVPPTPRGRPAGRKRRYVLSVLSLHSGNVEYRSVTPNGRPYDAETSDEEPAIRVRRKAR